MKRMLVALGVLALAYPTSTTAQEDLKKLDVWVGDWAWENYVKEGPSGTEQKIEGTGQYRRLGESFYVWHSQWKDAHGTEQSLIEITGYDPIEKAYFTQSFDSTGERATGSVTFTDTTVVVDRTSLSASGKKTRRRCTDVLADEGPFTCEDFTDGEWWASVRGKSKKTEETSAERNIAAVRRAADAMNAGNLAAFDELYDADYVIHVTGWPDMDRDQFRQAVATLRAAFPDFQIVLEDIFATEDRVAFRFTHHGTHRGEYEGVPPTGKKITWGGIVISRFEGGRWVEDWETSDSLGLMQQLGIVSLPQEDDR